MIGTPGLKSVFIFSTLINVSTIDTTNIHTKPHFCSKFNDGIDFRRKVYTYVDFNISARAFEDVSSTARTISLWSSSWAKHGWIPIIIEETDLACSSNYSAFKSISTNLASKVSSSRHGGDNASTPFVYRGIAQFFSMFVVGGGVLTDSDVINYGITPKALWGHHDEYEEKVLSHDGRKCFLDTGKSYPSASNLAIMKTKTGRVIKCSKINNGMTSGTKQSYGNLVNEMLRLQDEASYDTAKLLIDMGLIQRITQEGKFATVKLLAVSHNPNTDSWLHSEIVHFWGVGQKSWKETNCNAIKMMIINAM